MAENAIAGTTIEEVPPTPKSKLRIGRIVVWIVVALILLFLALGLMMAFAGPPLSGNSAPDFTMPLYGGGDFTLSEYQGQVVVINFWASWCGPCAVEAPDLERAWQEYKDQGVQFIGIDWVDAEAKGLGYIERYRITYPNGADLGTRIADSYEIRAVPETFIVNREGKVVFYAPRPVTYDELASEIEKALAGEEEANSQ
jgi:cytochrome c biogenesis protein CcmG, thiol:disulfide interchange protein DsbE